MVDGQKLKDKCLVIDDMMFSRFFASKQEVYELPEPSYEVEPEEDPEEDNEELRAVEAHVFGTPLAVQTWGEFCATYHFKSVRDVAPYLSSWCFNRTLNAEHKDKIKHELLRMGTPHLMGTIQVVRDKKGNCRVVNGQHRIKAVEEIIRDDINMNFHMHMMFEVYDIPIDDLDNIEEAHHDDIEKIFLTANASLLFRAEEDHELFCKHLVKAMMQDPLLKKGLVDKTTGTVHRPRILVKDLYEQFKARLPHDHGMTVEAMIARIKQINVQLSTMPNLKLFGRTHPAESKLRQRERAKEIGFYLNLNGRYPPEIWILMIPSLV